MIVKRKGSGEALDLVVTVSQPLDDGSEDVVYWCRARAAGDGAPLIPIAADEVEEMSDGSV